MFELSNEQVGILAFLAIIIVGITFAWLGYQLSKLHAEIQQLRTPQPPPPAPPVQQSPQQPPPPPKYP